MVIVLSASAMSVPPDSDVIDDAVLLSYHKCVQLYSRNSIFLYNPIPICYNVVKRIDH